jgi:hypothetical protein
VKQELVPQPTKVAFEDWRCLSSRRVEEVRKGFNSLVILSVWFLWKHMKSIFGGSPPSVAVALQVARYEALIVDHDWS